MNLIKKIGQVIAFIIAEFEEKGTTNIVQSVIKVIYYANRLYLSAYSDWIIDEVATYGLFYKISKHFDLFEDDGKFSSLQENEKEILTGPIIAVPGITVNNI